MLYPKLVGTSIDADFLREFGIDACVLFDSILSGDIDEDFEIEEGFLARFASLIPNLSRESKTFEILNDGELFDFQTSMLSRIELNTRILIWAQSKDAEKNVNYPEIMLPSNVTKFLEENGESEEEKQKEELLSMYSFIEEKKKEGFSESRAMELYNDYIES